MAASDARAAMAHGPRAPGLTGHAMADESRARDAEAAHRGGTGMEAAVDGYRHDVGGQRAGRAGERHAREAGMGNMPSARLEAATGSGQAARTQKAEVEGRRGRRGRGGDGPPFSMPVGGEDGGDGAGGWGADGGADLDTLARHVREMRR